MKFPFILCTAVFLAANAFAASIDFSNVNIRVGVGFGAFGDLKNVEVPPGDPKVIEVLTRPGFARFPTSPSALPGAFASAAFSGQKTGGAGVSGFVLRRQEANALAEYTQTIFNLDDSAEASFLTFDYTIPGIEVAIQAGPSITEGPVAEAIARLVATPFDADGNGLTPELVFSYVASINRTEGQNKIFVNDELEFDHKTVETFSINDVVGIRFGEFKQFRTLPRIPAGGRLELEYALDVEGRTQTPETGYQSFVGDPFNISGSGGFEIRQGEPAAVPEPATIMLAPGALIAILLSRRRQRRVQCSGRVAVGACREVRTDIRLEQQLSNRASSQTGRSVRDRQP